MGIVILVLLVGGALAYSRLTDEERLRVYAERWLHEFCGGEVHIDSVQLDPFRGLELVGVTVATPASADFDRLDHTLAARTIFRSRALFLRLRPFSIVSGNLAVPEIVATDPELTLVHRLNDDARNWQVLLKRRPKKGGVRPARLPVIRMRNLRLVQYRLDERGRSGGGVQVMWADAQPDRDDAQLYDLHVAKIFGDGSEAAMSREEGRLRINMRTLAIDGSVPSMSLDDLALVAPAEILKRLDVFHAHGFIRADSLLLDMQGTTEGTFALRDVSFSVPLGEEEEPLAADERFVQLNQMAGTIQIRGHRAALDLAGRFRDAPVTVKGEISLGSGGLTAADVGLDLQILVTGLTMPTDDDNTSPAEKRFVERWFKVHEFIKDYDVRGRVDLEVQVRKLPGADNSFQLVEGSLRPRGPSGRYFRFPYRLYDIVGEVHFRPDGRIELRDLTGVHGQGRAVINGLVDAYVSQGLDVSVQATTIDLDDDLMRCLTPGDRELVQLFNAQARMDIGVKMHRDGKPHGTSPADNPWTSAVDVAFTDGAVRFDDFPYPLDQLTGHLRIEGGGFEVSKLRGRRAQASVEVNGTARRQAQGVAELDLKLKAQSVPLDDLLFNALPEDARAMYAQIAPEGIAQVTGRVFSSGGDDPLHYDLLAALDGGKVSLPESQIRLSDTRAKIRIQPDELEIRSLEGRFGASQLSLSGRVGTHQGDPLSIHLSSDRLVLDESLYAALPAAIQQQWDTIHPEGPIRLDLEYAQAGISDSLPARPPEAFPPATQPAGWIGLQPFVPQPVPAPTYKAVIEPMNCSLVFQKFPWPLSGATGRLVLTPDCLDVENFRAQHEQTQLEVAGHVDLNGDRKNGQLRLAVRNLVFSEELRKVVPSRLRRLWNDVQPQGKVDLVLDRLTFVHAPTEESWDAQGYADLDSLSIDVGVPLTDLKGRITGTGGMSQSIAMNLDLALSQARVDGRLITEARMHMARKAGDAHLRMSDFTGRFFGGDVLGEMEVNYATGRPTFGLSLSGRGISLEKFLNAKRTPGQPPVAAKGTFDGTLDLAGRFGDPTSTRGAGNVFIREAHMFKVPLVLAILQVVHGAVQDDNAFHDAQFTYAISGEDLLLEEIDLRGKSLSMVGAGRVHIPDEQMDLTLLVGSPLKLPRIEVLTDLVEGVARELMQVRVQGTLDKPAFHAEMVRSVRKALDAVFNARQLPPARGPRRK